MVGGFDDPSHAQLDFGEVVEGDGVGFRGQRFVGHSRLLRKAGSIGGQAAGGTLAFAFESTPRDTLDQSRVRRQKGEDSRMVWNGPAEDRFAKSVNIAEYTVFEYIAAEYY